MKSIQKLSVAIIAVIVLSTGMTFAQPGGQRGYGNPPAPEDRQERMVDRLAYELKLTDEQKEKVAEIYTKHFEEMETLREQERKRFEEMQKLREEKRAEVAEDVKKELTEEQQLKYDEFSKGFGPRRGYGRRGNRRPGPGHCPRF